MASYENSTTNIAEDAIVIAGVVHSRVEFDVNQLTEQTPNASSSADVSSTSNNSVHSHLEFIGVEHQANTVEVDGNKVYTVGHTNRRFEVVNEFKRRRRKSNVAVVAAADPGAADPC
ncbi:hypothetical protein L1987_41632 [Smallanthus sonchifolius]|uniref:Uncharacterized protein n=1 Tax=Smallanthus sonchifolius TaxID=185202 RepID=A0ACB9GUS7_9ASTR|nr:hypothetical protein L1987_41632 [Smallanthus sonchifolius]